MKKNLLDQPHKTIKVYHLETRNANNDGVDKWFTSKKKAEEALADEINNDINLSLLEGGFTGCSAIYLSDGPTIDNENIEPYNKEAGTHYKSWREAAIDQWGFTAEWGCCSAMAGLAEHDAIKMENGDIYMLSKVYITKDEG